MPATIRPATVDDVESFVAMKNDAWRWAYAGLLPDDYLASLSVDAQAGFWRTAIASRERVGDVLLAVDDDGRVLGVASWGASRDDDATSLTGELDVLYVAPDHVGTGLGRQLMDEALDGLRRAGFRRATLWVLQENARGRGFYEHVGWEPDGVRADEVIECANHPMVRYVMTL